MTTLYVIFRFLSLSKQKMLFIYGETDSDRQQATLQDHGKEHRYDLSHYTLCREREDRPTRRLVI